MNLDNLSSFIPPHDGAPWGPGEFPADHYELVVDVLPAEAELFPGMRVGLPLGDLRAMDGLTEDPAGDPVILDLAPWAHESDDALVVIKYAPIAA